jgi:hypothetical protein
MKNFTAALLSFYESVVSNSVQSQTVNNSEVESINNNRTNFFKNISARIFLWGFYGLFSGLFKFFVSHFVTILKGSNISEKYRNYLDMVTGSRVYPNFAKASITSRSLIVVFALLTLNAQVGNAQCTGTSVAGTVFRDFNLNGVKDNANEIGLVGVTVKAFNSANTQVGSTTTTTAGTYSITGLSGSMRVEFSTLPAGYVSGPDGSTSGTSVQFVTLSTSVGCAVNYGVNHPDDFCAKSGVQPKVAVPCYINGSYIGPDAPNEDALVSFAYDKTGDKATAGNAPYTMSKYNTIGSVWGMAYNKYNKTLFATAFMKRHSGFGPKGIAGLYVIQNADNNGTGYTITGIDLKAVLGINAGTEPARNFAADKTKPSDDGGNAVFDAVGKMSFGDCELSTDGNTLYVVNLFDKKIYVINVANPTSPALITSFAVPNPACAVASEYAPFGLKYYRDKLYVGVVCTAQSSQPASVGALYGQAGFDATTLSSANLKATVYELNGSTFTMALTQFPLNYDRGFANSGLVSYSIWRPWVNSYSQVNTNRGQTYPQPILSDIEFDTDGSMILGFADRFSHQLGNANYPPLDALPNIVTNGNFNGGNSGFYSDYFYNFSGFNGSYVVSTDANTYISGAGSCTDHTSGTGNYLVADGSSFPNQRAWSQNIGIAPYTTYRLTFWANALNATNLPQLYFTVDGYRVWGRGQVASTSTDANGEYFFNDANVTGGLLPSMAYEIRVATSQVGNTFLSPTNTNANNSDNIDSDASLVGGNAVISLTTGAYGESNHTYDIGFSPNCPTLSNPQPKNGTVTVCAGTIPVLTLSASNVSSQPLPTATTIQWVWFSSAQANPYAGVNPNYLFPEVNLVDGTITSGFTNFPTTAGTYYVYACLKPVPDSNNPNCRPYVPYIVTVNPIPTSPTATPATICGTGTATLGASCTTGVAQWYVAATGGASVATGASYTTPSISTNTTYYVSCKTTEGCESVRVPVIATVIGKITDGGKILCDENVCPGKISYGIGSVTPASGGDASLAIEYAWLQTTSLTNGVCPQNIVGQTLYTQIPGVTSIDYQPGVIIQTTCYVRVSRRAGCTDYIGGESNIVKKTLLTTCQGKDPVCISRKMPVENNTLCGDVSGSYGMWFGNLKGNVISPNGLFSVKSGELTEFCDGTAVLNYTACVVGGGASDCINLALNLSGRTGTPPAGSPHSNTHCGCTYNPNLGEWYYYPISTGIFSGEGIYAGLTGTYTQNMEAFQVGIGGGLNDIAKFGASSWFKIGITNGGTNNWTGTDGDININLGTPTNIASVTASANPKAICSGEKVDLTATLDAVSKSVNCSPTYSWVGSNGFVSNQATATNTNVTTSTTYTVTVTFTAVNGTKCSVSATTSITVNPIPTAPTDAKISKGSICLGEQITLSGSCGSGQTAKWYDSANIAMTTLTFAPSPIGTYNYFVGCQDDVSKCETAGANRVKVTVVVNYIPVAPTSANVKGDARCEAGVVNLTATCTTGEKAEWYNSAGVFVFEGSAYSPSILTTQTYTVGCKNVAGCETPSGVRISVVGTVNPNLDAPTSSQVTPGQTCGAGMVKLTATCGTGQTPQWYNNNTTVGTPLFAGNTYNTPSISATTTYCVACKDDKTGCETAPSNRRAVVATFIREVDNGGQIAASQVYCGTTDPAAFTSVTPATGSSTTIEYIWLKYNGVPPTPIDPQGAGWATILGANGETYDVPTITAGLTPKVLTYIRCSRSAGCVDYTGESNILTITINPIPDAPIDAKSSKAVVCINEIYTLSASCPTGQTPQWYDGAGVAITNLTITPTAGGTYNYTVGCRNTSTTCETAGANRVKVSVLVNPIPTAPTDAKVSKGVICLGETVSLSGTCGTNEEPVWYSGSTTGTLIANTALTFTPTATGTYKYYVSCKSTTGALCETFAANRKEVVLVVNGLPTATTSVKDNTVCTGSTIELVGGVDGITSYKWSGPNGYSNSTQSPSIANAVGANTGNYILTVSNGNGCSATAVVSVSVLVNPVVTASGNVICANETVILKSGAVVNGTGHSVSTFAWTGPNSYTSNLQNPTIAKAQPDRTGTYTVLITDANGCTAVATAGVVVNILPTPTASSNTPICSGSELKLTVNEYVGGSYSWSGSVSFTSSLREPSIAKTITDNAGTYTVKVTDVNGCTATTTTTVVIDKCLKLGDFVWNDVNNNGKVDAGETGIDGVKVELFKANPDGTLGASAAPSQNTVAGKYLFTNLEPGDYIVQITAPAGYKSSTGTNGSPTGANEPAGDPDNDIGGDDNGTTVGTTQVIQSKPITLTNFGEPDTDGDTDKNSNLTVDFGLYKPGSIGDFVWYDLNRDGIQDAGEGGVKDVTVKLFDKDNNLVGTFTTGLDGKYIFKDLAPNDYRVEFSTLPTGYVFSPKGATTNDKDNDVDATGKTGTITLAEGQDITTVDAGINCSAPKATATGTTVCIGQKIDLTSLNTSSTLVDATYSWTKVGGTFTSTEQNPTVSVTATSADAGTYVVTMTSKNGCSATSTASAIIVVNALPTVTATGATVCAKDVIILKATGGGTYAWTNVKGFNSTLAEPTIASATAADGGVYTITVTNGTQCTAAATVNVVVNPLPTTAATGAEVCIGKEIKLTATAGFTSYAWTKVGSTTFTSTSQSPVVNASAVSGDAGVYQVLVTNAKGCTALATATVIVNELPTPTATNNGPVCVGTKIDLKATGGTSYAWAGSGFSATMQDVSIANAVPANAGVYTVTVTNAKGCVATATTEVKVNTNPAPVITPIAPICLGSDITLNVNVANAKYAWSGSNGFISTEQNPTVTPKPTTAGTYTYLVTVEGVGGCTASATTSVTVKPLPTVTVPSTSICTGTTGTMTSSSADSYSWSGPNNFTGTTQAVTVSKAGTYTVTISKDGCTAVATTTVEEKPTADIKAASVEICTGGVKVLTATGGATYAWTGANSFTATGATVTVPDAGTYTVTGTTAGGCVGTATATLTIKDNPIVKITGDTVICSGGKVTLTASGTGTFAWTGTGSFAATTAVVSVSAGTYQVTVTNAGCSAVGTIKVVNDNLTIQAGGATVCEGGSTQLTGGATATSGIKSYAWSGPNGFASTEQSPAVTKPSATGTYTLTVTSKAGCTATATAIITVTPAVTNTATVTFCKGGKATLTATGGTGATYLWTPGGATTSSIEVTAPGTYNVTITDATGCISKGIFTVTETTNPTAVISGAPFLCNGTSTDLTVNKGTTGETYSWTGVNGFTSTSQTITVTKEGEYFVKVITNGGCEATAKTTVSKGFTPTAVCGPVCEGQDLILNVSGGLTYSWSGPNGFTASSQNPQLLNVKKSDAGVYNVSITGDGCTATVVATLIVYDKVSGITATAQNSTCDQDTPKNDGAVKLAGTFTGLRYDIVQGATYTGTKKYADATTIPADGIVKSGIANPATNAGTTYTVRVFNANNCFQDYTVTIQQVVCSCGEAKCVPYGVTKTKSGKK